MRRQARTCAVRVVKAALEFFRSARVKLGEDCAKRGRGPTGKSKQPNQNRDVPIQKPERNVAASSPDRHLIVT
jgi:hypothetical protein